DEENGIADDEVEEPDHVAMVDGCNRFRFALEALAEVGIGEQLRLENLDGDAATDGEVLRGEDLAHGTDAEALDELVAAGDDLADEMPSPRKQLHEVFWHRVDARDAVRR